MACAVDISFARTASYISMQGIGRRHGAARAPTGGTCLQRIQHKWITAVLERQPAAAELVDALHPGKVTGGLFDHRDVLDGF
jgi:hypothetical protein